MKTSIKRTAKFSALVLLAFSKIIPSLDAATSCNSFPKIFGGSGADTIIT